MYSGIPFTNEAVLAFGAYMDNPDDDGPLAEIFDPQFLEWVKWQLAFLYDYGVPDEQMTQAHLDGLTLPPGQSPYYSE